jgi:hypothetical protein
VLAKALIQKDQQFYQLQRLCQFCLVTIDDAVEMIQSLGKGAKLGISDIKKAFMLLPVWPGDSHQAPIGKH